MKSILTAVVVVCSSVVLAGTCTWTGNGGDYKWSTAANWSGNAAPVDGDDVTIVDANAEAHGTRPSEMSLVKDDKGLLFKSGRKGLLLIVR